MLSNSQLGHCRLRPALLAVISLAFSLSDSLAQSDPPPSWNDGAVKQSIISFVGRVTRSGGAHFVPEAQRVAVFDKDGTLWAERPISFQLALKSATSTNEQRPDNRRHERTPRE
jgi:hypothetical protein